MALLPSIAGLAGEDIKEPTEMRTFALFALLLFSFLAVAQKTSMIAVPLLNKKGNEPFYSSRTLTLLSDTSGFAGIPSGLKEYKIKELTLRPSANKLFVLYGITAANERMIVFDTDFNKSFSGEKVYLFENDNRYDREKEKQVMDTTSEAGILLPGTSQPVFLKPSVYNCCARYKSPADSIWHLFVSTSYHREGKFTLNGQVFNLAISPSISPFYQGDRTTCLLSSHGFEKESDANQPYRFQRPIFIGNREFSVDSIGYLGDTAWMAYRGRKDTVFGNRQGQYALPIQTNSIEGNRFDLQERKGKYVLLDFWGTWCNPCIELIPRIRNLHEKFKDKNFALVSIAFDKKEDYAKLTKMIDEKQMTWTNLFDAQGSMNAIAKLYDVNCFPTSLLIDPQGRIIIRGCGEDDFKKVEKKLNRELQ